METRSALPFVSVEEAPLVDKAPAQHKALRLEEWIGRSQPTGRQTCHDAKEEVHEAVNQECAEPRNSGRGNPKISEPPRGMGFRGVAERRDNPFELFGPEAIEAEICDEQVK